MAMGSKRKEDAWASDDSGKPVSKRAPGRPKKTKITKTRNVQLRMPTDLIDEIDDYLDGDNRHRWILKTIKDGLKRARK